MPSPLPLASDKPIGSFIEPRGLMRTLATIPGWAAVTFLAVMQSACSLESNQASYNYRMTVNIRTPTGVRSGSGVVSVRVTGHQFPHTGASPRNYGAAFPVDLGDGRKLYVIPSRVDDGTAASRFVPAAWPKSRKIKDGMQMDFFEISKLISDSNFKLTLPTDLDPTFVIFRDIHNPATVIEVSRQNTTSTLGPCFQIEKVVVESTTEKPSREGIKDLPWVEGWRERHFDGSPASITDVTNSSIASRLSGGSFIGGVDRVTTP